MLAHAHSCMLCSCKMCINPLGDHDGGRGGGGGWGGGEGGAVSWGGVAVDAGYVDAFLGAALRATVPIPAVAAASVLHSGAVGGSVAGDVGPL